MGRRGEGGGSEWVVFRGCPWGDGTCHHNKKNLKTRKPSTELYTSVSLVSASQKITVVLIEFKLNSSHDLAVINDLFT